MKAMTIANTVGGFKTTGVFPLNREAVQLPKDNMERLNEQSGLSFIPLYTLSKLRKSVHKAEFSSEEMRKNQIRFESGYDVPNERYEAWVRRFHPEVHVLMHEIPHAVHPNHCPMLRILMPHFHFPVMWMGKCRDDCFHGCHTCHHPVIQPQFLDQRHTTEYHVADHHLILVFDVTVNHLLIIMFDCWEVTVLLENSWNFCHHLPGVMNLLSSCVEEFWPVQIASDVSKRKKEERKKQEA